MKKAKILNFALILTSFVGYLEWGLFESMFLIQGEIDIFKKLFTNPASIIHPFILLPLLGQILLVITLFQKEPNKILTYLGMGGIGLLLGLIFIIGLMILNVKIFCSSLPFLITSFFVIRHHRK